MASASNERRLKNYYLKHVILKRDGSEGDVEKFAKRLYYLYNQRFHFDSKTITRLYNLWARLGSRPVTHKTEQVEVERLLECLTLPASYVYGDFFYGSGAIPKSLPSLTFITNDIKTKCNTMYHFDVLNPGMWPAGVEIDAFVVSPPWELLDVILVDLFVRCKVFVAAHVAGDFTSNATPFRRQFLAGLQEKGCAAFVYGLPLVADRRRASWVVCCKCARKLKKLLTSNKCVYTFVF